MELEPAAKVSVERLRLDHLNPRLIGSGDYAPDEPIIARLYAAP